MFGHEKNGQFIAERKNNFFVENGVFAPKVRKKKG